MVFVRFGCWLLSHTLGEELIFLIIIPKFPVLGVIEILILILNEWSWNILIDDALLLLPTHVCFQSFLIFNRNSWKLRNRNLFGIRLRTSFEIYVHDLDSQIVIFSSCNDMLVKTDFSDEIYLYFAENFSKVVCSFASSKVK